jgi:dTDP-4-dehydrorhamnose reductase
LAAAIVTILRSKERRYGTFHFTNAGETTWFDFANEIKRLGLSYGLLERDCAVNALTTDQYPTKAKRPEYSVLSKEKIKAIYGVDVPDWKVSLDTYFKEDLTQRR